jgi:hypothetical protein
MIKSKSSEKKRGQGSMASSVSPQPSSARNSKSPFRKMLDVGASEHATSSPRARVTPKLWKAASYIAVIGEDGKLIFANDKIDSVPPLYKGVVEQAVAGAGLAEPGRRLSVVVQQESAGSEIVVRLQGLPPVLEGLFEPDSLVWFAIMHCRFGSGGNRRPDSRGGGVWTW